MGSPSIRRPKLFCTADIGNIVVVQWKSAIFASALISDSVGGNFVVAAPSDLETGDHTIYLYAVNQQGNIRSKEVKIDFSIGEKEAPWGDEYEPRRKVALIIFSTILVILIQVRRMGRKSRTTRGVAVSE